MPLTLTVTDNANNTGALASIAGADAATVTVYYMGPRHTAWQNGGSRSGNGTLTLSIVKGYYWAYAAGTVSGSPAVSLVSPMFPVTAGTESLQERILDAVKSGIQAIATAGSLPGLDPDSVYQRKFVTQDTAFIYPCVLLVNVGAESYLGGTNIRDDLGHPVGVQIATSRGIDDVADMTGILLWRERIERYFITQLLAGVPEVIGCNVEFMPIFDPRLPDFSKTVSAFQLRFRTREFRGV